MSDRDFWDISFTSYGIPRDLRHCAFENFEWDKRPGKKEIIKGFLEKLNERIQDSGPPPRMLMTGDPGRGKSHLSVSVYRWAILRTDAEVCTWLNVPNFCDQVKQSYNDEVDKDPWLVVDRARVLLVLDDIFGRELSQHESEQILNRLITTAHQNDAALLATTNFSYSELEARLNPHEISRLLQNAHIEEFRGEDYRI